MLERPATVAESAESAEAVAARRRLVATLTFEVVPTKGVAVAVDALPPNAQVSVTCSPVRGIDATKELSERLLVLGHVPVPHVSARLVGDHRDVRALAAWFRSHGITKAFVVGGDVERCGAYAGAVELLGDLLALDHGLEVVGVASYPDSHPFLTAETMREALHAKQELLDSAGVAGYCSTQMCFDPTRIGKWLRAEREQGLTLPVHLGIPGVVDRARLLTMGVRLGVGPSLRYLAKNRTAVRRLLTATAYDPNDLLAPLSADLVDLGVDGLHVFTFNQVAETERWRRRNT